ncbi:FMN-binding negative transcriptional regulator [Mangrovimonas futianensis]|uniref:FMN-binding negative transcriptional regulator n=1 Tax=Mangrovimonas futianensis TaxID=2895523 RepID=UPI001E41E0EA|nr:FMN-binding negative transcriptional regulator [Mangrovimonas futianensis]MCF1422071.1 FMN-binding negative transcriptional regulator [Mangrovimonas futianensis]
MYDIPVFKTQDSQKVIDFISKHPFAMLIGSNDTNEPVATQVPMFLEFENDRAYLRGHLMKHTTHYQAFEKNPQVLVIFQGPQTYVSATWYQNPHSASTWNYMSVHCKGNIKFLGQESLESILQQTTLHFENGNHDSPTVFNNLPKDYKDRLMKAIVSFEIEVTNMEHVFKLSQNQDAKSFQNIISELKKGDSQAQEIAEEMEKLKK